nr:FRG domain-containing protein [Pseudomonas benzenivorans]
MKQVSIAINTTGNEITDGHRVIEIAAIELINKTITGRHFHCYINPYRKISEAFIAIHGITEEFLQDKPPFRDIITELDDFLSDHEILTAETKALEFLANEFELHRVSPQNPSIRRNSKKSSLNDLLTQSTYNAFCLARENFDLESNDMFGALLDAEIQADSYISATNNEIIVESLTDLLEKIKDSNPNDLFRGVSDRNYKLLPSLFRHTLDDHKAREQKMMWVFKAQARAYLERLPENEIQWLTLAQHHGLPTRVLDWSLSPLVACFFATQSNPKKDGAIYIYEARKYEREENINIGKLKEVTHFLPSHGSKRLTAQSGVFTIHPDSQPEFDTPQITKLIIPKSKKESFRKTLSKYGVNSSTMFPDLDGLSFHIKSQNNY